MENIIVEHLENLKNYKNIDIDSSDYEQERNLQGYITLYSYGNFIREVKHFFRNNKYNQDNNDKYLNSNYRQWKVKYDDLTLKSFEILKFILMLENTITSVIIELVISNKLNNDEKFIEEVVKSIFVKRICENTIEKELSSLGETDYSIHNYAKNKIALCIQKMSYVELMNLLNYFLKNKKDYFDKIIEVIIFHPKYKDMSSYFDTMNVVHQLKKKLIGELESIFKQYKISFDDVLCEEDIFYDIEFKKMFFEEFNKAVHDFLTLTIRNNNDQKYYLKFQAKDGNIVKKKINFDVSKHSDFISNIKYLRKNYFDLKKAKLRKLPEYKKCYNLLESTYYSDFIKCK